jgi:2-hydroxycyclohexanecarboxyl-CoA dehydrogenase
MRLAGKRCLITGGSRGLGRALGEAFAAAGAKVAFTFHSDVADADAARASLRQLGCEPLVFRGSVADGAHVKDTVAAIVREWGGVDVLVNNAGWSQPGFFADQTDRALWQRTIEVNLFTAIACTQAVLGPMRAGGGGAMVFISSDSAFGAIRQGIYGSTKAGLISLARTVARENGRHGIRSNVIAPGLVLPDEDTEPGPHSVWARGRDAIFTAEQADYVLRQQPLRRMTTSADIAGAVLWISSPLAARQVTGQVVAVGGGSAMP